MASVYVTIGKAGAFGANGVPVFSGTMASEVITSSGTSAAGALTAAGDGYCAQV